MSSDDGRIARGARTRQAMVRTARRLFRRGYAQVGTPDIVAAAGITRGALYHHFKDKRDLFAAAVEDLAADLVERIDAAAQARLPDPRAAVIAGCHAFLQVTQAPEMRQILLIDGPAVLGWQAWRKIDARHGLGSLKAGLRACADAGLMEPGRIDAVADLISGALNEAAFAIAETRNSNAIKKQQDKALHDEVERLVQALVRMRGRD